ncbi:15084_t:CDS:2, partial [Racocetra fulgida]
ERKTILSAALFEVDENFTFEHLLYQADSDYTPGESIRIDIQVKGTNTWHHVISGLEESLVMCTREEQNVSHIRFTIQNERSASPISSSSNIFNEMMNASAKKVLPDLKPTTNQLLRKNNLGWEYGTHNSVGKSFVNKLASLIYYLDDKHKTLKQCSLNIPLIFLQLPLYQQNSYYKNGSHHKAILKHEELEFHADKLEESVLVPWASKPSWDQIISVTIELYSVARSYANYLEAVNKHVQKIQAASTPTRSPEDDNVLEIRPSCLVDDIKDIYFPISEQIKLADKYEVISLEEFLPETKK